MGPVLIAFVALAAATAYFARLILKRRAEEKKRLIDETAPEAEWKPPDILDLVREEVAETGVDRVEGHEDLPYPVLLKVWRRDVEIRREHTHDQVRFEVRAGVVRAAATEADVWLRSLVTGATGDATPREPEADASSSGGEAGNNGAASGV